MFGFNDTLQKRCYGCSARTRLHKMNLIGHASHAPSSQETNSIYAIFASHLRGNHVECRRLLYKTHSRSKSQEAMVMGHGIAQILFSFRRFMAHVAQENVCQEDWSLASASENSAGGVGPCEGAQNVMTGCKSLFRQCHCLSGFLKQRVRGNH